MKIQEILKQKIEVYTKQQPRVTTYEEHLKQREIIEPRVDVQYRSIESIVHMTGWKTSNQCIQEMIGSSLDYNNIQAWYVPFPDNQQCEQHMHDHIELLYVVEGILQVQVAQQDVQVKTGELLLISPEVKHREYLKPENCIVLCLGINDLFFSGYMTENEQLDYARHIKNWIEEKRNDYLYMHFYPATRNIEEEAQENWNLLTKEMLSAKAGRREIVIGCVKRLLNQLTKQYTFTVATKDKTTFHQALCKDICLYIKQQYIEVTAKQIGDVFHYSSDHLNRLFRKFMGMTLSSYIQKVRLEQAAVLLCQSTLPIEEICKSVGYQNQGFLIKNLKRNMAYCLWHIGKNQQCIKCECMR